MPRITKAEVRASIAEAKEKAAKKKSKEDFFRAQKAKEERPYPVFQEGADVSVPTEERLAEPEDKTSTKIAPVDNKIEDKAPVKTVNISNFDPTLVTTAVNKPAKTEMLVIDRAEVESAREDMSQMKEELEEAKAIISKKDDEIKGIQSELREITLEKDTVQDSYEKRLSEEHEKYNKMLLEKNEEVSNLKAQLLVAQKTLEQQEEAPKEKKIISDKAQKIIAYSFYTLFSAGILGLIAMLIIKGLTALGGWLF